MKRFAAHYIYLLPGKVYKQYVVELDGKNVSHLFPFNEEIESTIWLDGIILLSSVSDYLFIENQSFNELLQCLCYPHEGALYAYHLSGINLNTLVLLPSASLRQL